MDTRPTSDRLRETLFDVLTGGNPGALSGSVWIDLFAGSGAVGIEALSRGAQMVYFIESSAAAIKAIRANLESLKITGGFDIADRDALRGLRKLDAAAVQADYVFLDPPYRLHAAYEQVLEFLSQSGILRSESLITAEHDKRFDPGDRIGGIARTRLLTQGDSALSFYRLG